jgi:xanthine dehydrogenase/oxidase
MSLVISSKAHAKIISVDASLALSEPGVLDYICHTDIPASNITGSVVFYQEIMASDKVT